MATAVDVNGSAERPMGADAVRHDPAAWHHRFHRDGFAVCTGALDAALLALLRERADRLTDADGMTPALRPFIDLEPELLDGRSVVQRVRRPHDVDPFFFELAGSPALLSVLRPLLGGNIRLHHSKINVKAPRVGSPLEWHQDWAFIPHTNGSLAIVSILIDDCMAHSGPLQLIPGSHRGPLHPHHQDGVFVGAIDPALLDLSTARPVTGPAGTTTVHHPMTVHGSGFNLGQGPRRVLFLEYAAADAWPLFYGVEWGDFNRRMVCGESTADVRMEPLQVRMPHPSGTDVQGRIYDQQRRFLKRHFTAPASG